MHAQITIETTYDDGTANRTHVILGDNAPYNPTIAADLLDKVRATHDHILEDLYANLADDPEDDQ